MMNERSFGIKSHVWRREACFLPSGGCFFTGPLPAGTAACADERLEDRMNHAGAPVRSGLPEPLRASSDQADFLRLGVPLYRRFDTFSTSMAEIRNSNPLSMYSSRVVIDFRCQYLSAQVWAKLTK